MDHNSYNTNNLSWQTYPSSPVYGTNEVVGPNDLMVTNYNWQSSWFGNFYLPPNSLVIQKGSTNANLLGLYWFTTQTNQTPETDATVDIGYHYVATDTNGNPLTSPGTNVPNYILYPDGPPPNTLQIVTEPVNQTVMQGSNATFSVTVEGNPPLSYQWFWNGAPLSDEGGISGSGNPTLNLTGVNPDQAGSYYVVVSNSSEAISVTSTSAVLTVELSVTNDYDTLPLYLMPPYAYWNVTDISDPAQPVNIGELQAPFSEPAYGQFDTPPPNTLWHASTDMGFSEAYGTTYSGGQSNLGTVFEIDVTNDTLVTLHSFGGTGDGDGAYPCSQLAVSGSTFYGISNILYGTTSSGGSNGYGTVFKVNADGTGFTNLYEFTGGSDGGNPQTGLLIDGNTLYGTTTNSIFKINTDGSDFTCLTNISGASQLILSLSGTTLYGTTEYGGIGYGSVFSINTDGSGFTNLYEFTGHTNGQYPKSGLELYGIGNSFQGGPTNLTFFGTTYSGGSNGFGMVFSINADGSGFTNLYDFDGTNDGAYPVGGLLITNNNANGSVGYGFFGSTYLFGTTSRGGTNNGGTVFGMHLDGTGFQTLYSFGSTNGVGTAPEGKLAFMGAVLYGTTANGGACTNGMMFSINTTNDSVSFSDLYDFNGTNDGGSPLAGLTFSASDNLQSIWSLDTTINVSANDLTNALYSIAMDNYDILYLNGTNVSWAALSEAQWSPYTSLAPYLHPGENDIKVIIGGDGDANDYFAMAIKVPSALTNILFGTASSGGSNGFGTVFEISPGGYETNLYSFKGLDETDGVSPNGDLVLSGNTLYGVTKNGGTVGAGTIFSISTNGSGYTNIYSFDGSTNGNNPLVGLLLAGGTLYGTTDSGGTNGLGAIFSISTNGANYRVLYSFGSTNNDGINPDSPLVLIGTNLYGTTQVGGANTLYGVGEGTIFSISTNGSVYQVVYNFGSTAGDGYGPQGRLSVSGSTLYGTTAPNSSPGTIFSFTIGSTTDQVLHAFGNTPGDGADPQNGLTLLGKTLYGTTESGGAHGLGSIFSVGTNGIGYTNFYSFNGYYGEIPDADLLILGNSLFGTAEDGGAYPLNGMVFSISTNGTGFEDIYDFWGDANGANDGANPEGGVCSP